MKARSGGAQAGEPAAPGRSGRRRSLNCGAEGGARIQDRSPTEAWELGYEHERAKMAQVWRTETRRELPKGKVPVMCTPVPLRQWLSTTCSSSRCDSKRLGGEQVCGNCEQPGDRKRRRARAPPRMGGVRGLGSQRGKITSNTKRVQ